MTETIALSGHKSRIWSLAFDVSGRMLVTGEEDGTICVWNLAAASRVEPMRLTGHYYRVFSLSVHPNQAVIASGGYDRTVRIWRPDSNLELLKLHTHEHRVRCVAFSPGGDFLVTGSEDQTFIIWSVPSAIERDIKWPVLHGPVNIGASVTCIAFHPKRSHLAVGGSDGMVRIWDFARGAWVDEAYSFSAHEKQVLSLAYSPDGERLFTGSQNASTVMWDATSFREIHRWKEHYDWVETVAFRSDGRQAASGSDDQHLIFYEASSPWRASVRQGKRPYEGTNITGITGVSETQRSILERLGATDVTNAEGSAETA